MTNTYKHSSPCNKQNVIKDLGILVFPSNYHSCFLTISAIFDIIKQSAYDLSTA